MKSEYEKNLNLLPKLKAIQDFNSIVLKDYISLGQILKYLNTTKFEDFRFFINTIFKSSFLKILIHGNYKRESALNLQKIIEENFFYYPLVNKNDNETDFSNFQNLVNYKTKHCNISGYNIHRVQLKDNHNQEHAILNFYQMGPESIENIYVSNLIKVIVGYVYFTELRIKEQLGYSTNGKIFNQNGVIYFVISVQGSRVTPDIIDIKIENVINIMRSRIEEITQDKLEKIKFAVEKKLNKRENMLKSRTNRLWNEIILSRNFFNFQKMLQKYLKANSKKITNKYILQFFDKVFSKNLCKLSIQEFSRNVLLKEKQDKLNNIPKITRSHETNSTNMSPVIIDDLNYFRKKNNLI